MARTVRDANLETREARRKLRQRGKPYFRLIEHGKHLGYRKTAEGGTWVARLYAGHRKYRTDGIGSTDDTLDADGDTVLTFAQAQAKARDWFAAQARPGHGRYSVADAINAYLGWFRAETDSTSSLRTIQNAVDTHILPALGDVQVSDLTPERIEDWHRRLAAAPAMLRTRKGAAKRNVRATGDDRDAKRRRKATANRILTVLKAALNRAYRAGKVASDDAWRKVQPFRKVDAAKVRYLTKAECQRLVNTAGADLRPMVRAALLTGCRYGELAALRVGDFNPDAGTLTIRHSKAGKPRHVPLDDDGQAFFAGIVAGKASREVLFHRAGGATWGESHQLRPMREACQRAKIDPPASFHILRHTYASHLAMNGVPMAVIAAILGHGDTRMTEKHYAHLSPDHVALTLRANAPKLGIVEASNVRALGGKA